MNNKTEEAIKQIRTEEILSATFIVLGILSIYGDEIQKKYITTNDYEYEKKDTNIFRLVLLITFILYIVFLYRSYKSYENAPIKEKEIFKVKLLGSCFFLAGIICTIYFQLSRQNTLGAPEI